MNKATRINYTLRLSCYIKGFGWYLLASILCNMSFKLLPLLSGLTTSYLVSSVLFGYSSRVVSLLVTTGVLVILTALFSYLDVQVSHEMAYRILTQLRNYCYNKLNDLAPAALMGKRSGDMISIVLGDVEQLEWFYAHTIGQLVVAVAVLTAALIFMGWISWVLPIVILPFIALLVFIPRYSATKADEQGSEVKQTTGILHAIIIDGVQGIKDIISFRWQQEYMKRFFCADQNYSKASIAYAKRRGNESRSITLIMGLASLTINIVAAALVVAGKIPAIWLMPLFILSSAIFLPIQEALTMSTNYGLIFGAAQRVLALFDMQPLVQDNGKKNIENCSEFVVHFNNVSFAYPATEEEKPTTAVLNGLDFVFRTGETVALVGESGEGKTTVARLLQRFWDVDTGKITINGQDIRELSINSLRSAVTVVPQEVYLFNISVEENLRLASLNASDGEIHEAAQLAQADYFISKLPNGYKTLIGERGLRLSGGEKQRLSIAQAFLKNAPILVLDEASANLDAENERMINEAVSQLKIGRATLVIAHRISTICNADRVVMLKNGRVLASGSYEELIENCLDFRKLVGEEYEVSNKEQAE